MKRLKLLLIPIIFLCFEQLPLWGEVVQHEWIPKIFSVCSLTAEQALLQVDDKYRNQWILGEEDAIAKKHPIVSIISVNDEERELISDFHASFRITPVKHSNSTMWIFRNTFNGVSFGKGVNHTFFGWKAAKDGTVTPLSSNELKEYGKKIIAKITDTYDPEIFETSLDDNVKELLTIKRDVKESIKRKARERKKKETIDPEVKEAPAPTRETHIAPAQVQKPFPAAPTKVPFLLYLLAALLLLGTGGIVIFKKRSKKPQPPTTR